MENKNLKNKLQELKTYASPLDIPTEWDALEKRMDKKKKRRFIIWWFPLLVGVGMVGYWALTANSKHLHADMQVVHEADKSEENHPSALTFDAADKDNATLGISIIDHDISASSIIISDIVNNPGHPEQKVAVTSMIKPVKAGENINLTNSENTINIQDNTINSLTENNQKNRWKEEEVILENQTKPTDKVNTEGYNLTELLAMKELQPFDVSHEFSSLEESIQPLRKPLTWFTDVRMMAGVHHYRYQNVAQEANHVMAMRKASERPLETYGALWTLGKNLGRDFYMSAGLILYRSNDKWQRSKRDTISVIIEGQVIEEYTNHAGVIETTNGNKAAIKVSDLVQTRYNHTTTVAPMIAIGKRLHVFKMRWSMEANVALPLSTTHVGQVWDDRQNIVNMAQTYTPKNYLQYGFNLSYIYPISANWHIYGGYQYQFSRLQSTSGYFRNQNFHGLSAGVKYYIN
ncbi:MAG: hypothetical protein LC107_01020 [Chitinophagales bacterium]|nr:hypothetical protein [Chitinophagales bacterium]